jgi:hypothetical protein
MLLTTVESEKPAFLRVFALNPSVWLGREPSVCGLRFPDFQASDPVCDFQEIIVFDHSLRGCLPALLCASIRCSAGIQPR